MLRHSLPLFASFHEANQRKRLEPFASRTKAFAKERRGESNRAKSADTVTSSFQMREMLVAFPLANQQNYVIFIYATKVDMHTSA